MRILVTGGAGYIGSVITEQLIEQEHEVVVLDNLSRGHKSAVVEGAAFIEMDLQDPSIRDVLKKHRIEAVIHMAASSLVGESVHMPRQYYENNVGGSISLLNAMLDTDVRRIVFSSSAAVYGEPSRQPIEESDPADPTNPYGETKLAFEKILKWFSSAYGIEYTSLRYFNAAGATIRCGESHDPESHLIPNVLLAAAGQRAHVEIFGGDYPTRDGTCIRDYIHVVDLARAHILALESRGERNCIYNLGCGGHGYSVHEVIRVAKEITGREIPVKMGPRRQGDPAVLIAGSDRIHREFGWEPTLQNLHSIIESAWKWMLAHPEGYPE